MAKPRKKRASRTSKRLLLQIVEQDREAFTRIVEAVCPETLQLGQSGAKHEEFGKAAGQIAQVQIDRRELAIYIYERIHDKSIAMVREINRPHIRPRPALPGGGADELEMTPAARAAMLATVLLPGALQYNLETCFAFTLRSVESIARCATSGERADHEKLLADIRRELAKGLKALHQKAGRRVGAKDSDHARRRVDRMETDKKIDQLIVAAREEDLGDDSADAASVEAWNETWSARKLANRLGPDVSKLKRRTLRRYISDARKRPVG